jgi:hypothetical protein
MNPERSLVLRNLTETGYACLSPAEAAAALQLDLAGLEALRGSWQRLPRDSYLRDAGDYRARRQLLHPDAGRIAGRGTTGALATHLYNAARWPDALV